MVIRIGPGKVRELDLLPHPGPAEVADEVLVFLQFGIAVRRQHLAVRVDVDALAVGLFEQRLQIDEIVAGDEDGLARPVSHQHRGGRRLAERFGVGRVEQREHGDGDLAALEVERQELVDVGEAAIDRVERLDDESVDLRVGAAHLARVMRVGGHSLQSVDQQFLQAGDILAERRLARLDARAVGPGEDCVATGVGGDPGRRTGRGDDAPDDLRGPCPDRNSRS